MEQRDIRTAAKGSKVESSVTQDGIDANNLTAPSAESVYSNRHLQKGFWVNYTSAGIEHAVGRRQHPTLREYRATAGKIKPKSNIQV